MKIYNQNTARKLSGGFATILLLCLLIIVQNTLISQDFFWVGGTGNWSDTTHWVSEKGGLPTISDNVFFNDTSFTDTGEKVNIDVHAFCNTMDWSGVSKNPRLIADSSITIDGSLIFHPGMKVTSKAEFFFTTSKADQVVNTHNIPIKSNIFFIGSGSWQLESDLNNGDSTLYLQHGSFDTKSFDITCGSFSSRGGDDRSLILNSSTIYIQGLHGFWDVTNKLSIQKGSSTIIFVNESPASEAIFKGAALAYRKVEFRKHGSIRSSNKFDVLKLTAGNSYSLESGKTQTIVVNFIARGCSGLINIHPSGSERAIIRKPSGDIDISFVSLKSIEADMTGGLFNAHNSIDHGGNLNCNILKNTRDMYWVNGTGSWSDTLHWNMSPPQGTDSRCVPISYDNVFFDINSFSANDTVKVDLNSTYCHDMIWSSNQPVVFKNELDSSDMNIYGSLQFSNGIENLFDGDFYFRDSTSNQFIRPNGVPFSGDIFFAGKGGWNIAGQLTSDGDIYFNKGTLNTQNNPIQCASFISDSSHIRLLDVQNSTIILNSNSVVPDLSLNNENLVLKQNNSLFVCERPGALFKIFGGDTIRFHDLRFTSEDDRARLRNDTTYSIFNKVLMAGNSEIYGNNSFDSLFLSSGNVHAIQTGKVQTIVRGLSASGNCNEPLMLRSVRNGSGAYISKSSGLVEVHHATLRDITVTGGATFKAYNTVDLGNNNGWDEINSAAYRELYWVGGEGKWSNTQHWSLSSNGAGGECVPTAADDVVIDQFSFTQSGDSLIIDSRNAFCKSMSWSEEVNQPVFYGDDYANLRIFGSLDLTKHMDFNFNGPLYFESSQPGNSISSDGIKFYNNNNDFYFDGVGGEWTLKDSLDLGLSSTITNNIQFINGTLKTNNQEVSCFSFLSRTSFPRKIVFGESTINVFNAFYMHGVGLDLVDNKSEINIYRGSFIHRKGNNDKYNNLNFKGISSNQRLLAWDTDSLSFNKVVFEAEGLVSGYNSNVIATEIDFLDEGQINQPDTTEINTHSIEKLKFHSVGLVYGNNLCNQVIFDSTAYINGKNMFGHSDFNDHGQILGNNSFDSLIFQPGHFYELEELQVQTINHYLDIRGNNCEPIYLSSMGQNKAGLYKANDTVFGEFIEMYNIDAQGGAYFDAGWFSDDINNSNDGWVFHDNPLQFKLDTVIYDIDQEVEICASNFNGTAGTKYIWQKYPEGDTLSYDSCLTLTPDNLGLFTLTVIYDEGEGCIRYDTLLWGCQYFVDLDKKNINCYNFKDGYIELDVQEGTGNEPFEVRWYKDDDFLSNSSRIENLDIGEYHFIIEDGDGCTQSGSYQITQPDSLSVDFYVNYFTYFIDAIVEGGTGPYDYLWNSGSNASFEKVIESGRHEITIVDSNNCLVNSAIFIDLRYKIMAPTAFSPNGDGLNDEFIIYWQGPDIKYYLLEIYDRWGKKIYESTDPDNYWNGKFSNQGDVLPIGTYVWRLNVETVNSKQETDQGIINLIR